MTLTAPTTTSSWSRALSLRERRGASAPPARADLAERRLARWQSQPPLTDPKLFSQRLNNEELTEAELRTLLGESLSDLARRIDGLPGWVNELTDALANPAPFTSDAPDNELALLAAIQPLVARARQRVRDAAEALLVNAGSRVFEPAQVVAALADVLPGRLFPMLARTMALELQGASLQGALAGDTPAERFWSFVTYLAEGGGLDLLEAYPVLGRQVATCVEQWVETCIEFLGRLVDDLALIAHTFSPMQDPGQLVGVQGGLSDPHDGGRGVLILSFASGVRVVYKPNPLPVDAQFSGPARLAERTRLAAAAASTGCRRSTELRLDGVRRKRCVRND
jgi:hypothetical protein